MSTTTQHIQFLCSDGKRITVTVRKRRYVKDGEAYFAHRIRFPPGVVLPDDAWNFVYENLTKAPPTRMRIDGRPVVAERE